MKLAVFDFDGTILQRDTLPCLGQAWKMQNRPKKPYYQAMMNVLPTLFQYKLSIISNLAMRRVIMDKFIILFDGMKQAEIEQFFTETYDYMVDYFNPLVLNEIEIVKKEGYHLVLLSGSFQELLDIVGEHLGFDTVIGAKVKYSADQVINRMKKIDHVAGEGKYTKLTGYFKEQTIDWENSCSYADSFSDLYILQPVGYPILVNPDQELKRWGEQKGCRIIGRP